MLAGRRYFFAGKQEVISTPLLVPSFSSKGFRDPNVQEIFAQTLTSIDGSLLVSAYDIADGTLKASFDIPGAVFLDSGGYEANKDFELSEIYADAYFPKKWTIAEYERVISEWSCDRPTVIVSYDNRSESRLSFQEQIDRADRYIPRRPNIFREILIKPDKDQALIDVVALNDLINEMARFDAIGITEKDIGDTIKDRMRNIALIRQALIKSNQAYKPIHVFGSLDTITTPLYFIAGADVFDGLTWLRFGYYRGLTIYRENFAAMGFDLNVSGLDFPPLAVKKICWTENCRYLSTLQKDMRRFIETKSFDAFSYNAELLERAYHSLLGKPEV